MTEPSLRYIRRLVGLDAYEAAAICQIWGYPRKIELEEKEQGIWYGFGPDPPSVDTDHGFAWFIGVPEEVHPNARCVHACSRPRTILGTARNLVAIEVIAEILGARRLYSILPEGSEGRLPVRTMRRYLTRKGWTEDRWGVYTDLGG